MPSASPGWGHNPCGGPLGLQDPSLEFLEAGWVCRERQGSGPPNRPRPGLRTGWRPRAGPRWGKKWGGPPPTASRLRLPHLPMGWGLGAGPTGLGTGIGCDCGKKDKTEGGWRKRAPLSQSAVPSNTWNRVPSGAGNRTREGHHIGGGTVTGTHMTGDSRAGLPSEASRRPLRGPPRSPSLSQCQLDPSLRP